MSGARLSFPQRDHRCHRTRAFSSGIRDFRLAQLETPIRKPFAVRSRAIGIQCKALGRAAREFAKVRRVLTFETARINAFKRLSDGD